jgi:hypothetical protein
MRKLARWKPQPSMLSLGLSDFASMKIVVFASSHQNYSYDEIAIRPNVRLKLAKLVRYLS